MIAAVAVVVCHADRVLLMRRAAHRVGAGIWETVSGRIEAGEEPLGTAQREVLEETGLRALVDPRPVDAYTAMRGEEPMLIVAYRATVEGDNVVRSPEHDAHVWVRADELGEHPIPERLLRAVLASVVQC